ncbi:hypothetical protein HPHPH21_1073 [Helicobacter pylori Hp H-21]|nr:hypothetical protein HPHPH21_1073 [Helicobacter pylori Hp H-21]
MACFIPLFKNIRSVHYSASDRAVLKRLEKSKTLFYEKI